MATKNGEQKISVETTMRMEAVCKQHPVATPAIVMLFGSCENEQQVNKVIDGINDSKATSYQINLAYEEIFNKDIDGLRTCLSDGLFLEILEMYKAMLRQD